MRRLIAILAVLALGACTHRHEVDVNQPEQHSEHDVYAGTSDSYSDVYSSERSDYELCLEENAGYGDAEKICNKRFEAAGPSDGPNLPW